MRLAIGTETDGSVTCPASINGIVGLKPTVGLVSRTHVVPISHSQDTAGPMTASVREAAEVLTAIAGSDPADPATARGRQAQARICRGARRRFAEGQAHRRDALRLGFGTDAAFETALAVLRARGAILVDIKKFDDSEIGGNEIPVLLAELKADIAKYLTSSPAPIPVPHPRRRHRLRPGAREQEIACSARNCSSRPRRRRARRSGLQEGARDEPLAAGPNGIDKLLKRIQGRRLVGPTMPPAWKIDAVNGDQTRAAARARSRRSPAIRTSPCRWAR